MIRQWNDALETARRGGYEIVPLKDGPDAGRVADFADTWKDTFKSHWGFTPLSQDKISLLIEAFKPAGAFDLRDRLP
jgi:hypothetical protein